MRKAGLGMKAADLATLLGMAPETFSRWETAEREAPHLSWATVAELVLERGYVDVATPAPRNS
jgi:transcriptional regulator with XRE-family HTH domain